MAKATEITVDADIINRWETVESIWATMYGSEEDDILELRKDEVTFCPDKGYIWFRWGAPGPDWNFYYFSDYGKTWAFTKEDFITEHKEV